MADPSSQLRVSDQDRDEAALQIREHYAAGRLTDDELNERPEAGLRRAHRGGPGRDPS
jgi:hypothetical protein